MTATRIVPANVSLYALIGALLAASISLQVVRDRGWQPYTPEQGLLWVRSGEVARRLALSFDNLAADVYWMRTVVYFGAQRLKNVPQDGYDQLFPLLELVTSLDPHFNVAYQVRRDVLAYATYSEGYKSGGFTQRIFPAQVLVPDFDPEFVKVVELGLKSELFDRRLRLNAAAFHTDYDDMQVMVHSEGGIGIPMFISSLDGHNSKLKGLSSIPISGMMGSSFAEHVWLDA